ncbi:hypothetical protein [Niabella sp.]|uniref:hypothetical protein n=1 Tax=Niabella sp. TaxID=1962976 RepID=UPI00261FB19F|nr:hypothetical protein [Niabella sp.]
MTPFLKKHWINILTLAIGLLVFFYFSDEEHHYLHYDFRALRSRARTAFLWINIIGVLLVFLLGIRRDHKRNEIFYWGFRCILGVLFSLLVFDKAFIYTTLFANRFSSKGTAEKAYVVMHAYKHTNTKWPLLLKDTSLDKRFLTRPINGYELANEGDTLVILFSKGQFDVNVDPRIKMIKKRNEALLSVDDR